MHEVSISAEKLFTLFGVLPVTNTLLTAWVVMFFIIIVAFVGTRKMKTVPSGLQNVLEVCIGGLESIMTGIVGNRKKAQEFFAIAATIFIFVLFSNWFGLLPGVGSIVLHENEVSTKAGQTHEAVTTNATEAEQTHETVTTNATEAEQTHETVTTTAPEAVSTDAPEAEAHIASVPLFRAASSDLSFTLAIALWAIIYVQYIGFKHLKFHYLGKFFNFKNPILFFVGLLELVSEFGKIISFSFRLFGNVFAGEVLLVVMTFLVPIIIPVPFYGLEVFVGMVQAGVFAALTLVFLNGATAHH